jgi:hypothetical protein
MFICTSSEYYVVILSYKTFKVTSYPNFFCQVIQTSLLPRPPVLLSLGHQLWVAQIYTDFDSRASFSAMSPPSVIQMMKWILLSIDEMILTSPTALPFCFLLCSFLISFTDTLLVELLVRQIQWSPHEQSQHRFCKLDKSIDSLQSFYMPLWFYRRCKLNSTNHPNVI